MARGCKDGGTNDWMPPFSDSELIIGLVAPVGTDLDLVIGSIERLLKRARYKTNKIHIVTDVIEKTGKYDFSGSSPFEVAMKKMTAGNDARQKAQDNAILALGAAWHILEKRPVELKPMTRQAHIIRSLKHPEEVERMREIYPQGFYLIGVYADEERRLKCLVGRGMSEDEARKLMGRGENERMPYGQKEAGTFHMADFFVRLDIHADQLPNSINRIIDIIMGYPYHTPTFDEYAMYLAYAASLRSADLARQVGAVIACEKNNEVLATGANDCPKFGGGLYWPIKSDGEIKDDKNGRDYKRGEDPNEAERKALIDEICNSAREHSMPVDKLGDLLESSSLRDITEYGRVVHAEMEALLACSRNGLSTRNTTLYGTTYPCHNCAKHIIAAGVTRVVYVEPYPKSKAQKLHDDSITVWSEKEHAHDTDGSQKVCFEPFVGVGPRRFFDLFSTRLGTGRRLLRKKNGVIINWQLENSSMRRQMLPYSYLELEAAAANHFEKFKQKKEVHNEKKGRRRRSEKKGD